MTTEVKHTFDDAVKVAAQFEDLEEALRGAADRPGEGQSGTLGYVAYACGAVETAIFDALNALASFLHQEEAERHLDGGHGWQDAKRLARREGLS